MPLPNLGAFFNSLVQAITLCRSQDVEEYLNEKVRKAKYADLPREIVVMMLEKYVRRGAGEGWRGWGVGGGGGGVGVGVGWGDRS